MLAVRWGPAGYGRIIGRKGNDWASNSRGIVAVENYGHRFPATLA